MNGSLTLTLPRERPSPSPKCFGKNTHILKEDYERERLRWEKKLEESEQRLMEAAAHNSELFQLKAEQNRKIIDFEKAQKPLIEQNRRLNERIRAANMETRKLEEKLAHVQDELLTLRDQYERVVKENGALREQRAFPEKLEELGRYRAQVLEMSKCITALRQSAAEKDRRHELLVLKLKRMRRAAQQESDRQSCAAGSEGSVEDSGSLGLDTITEDLDEEVELNGDLLVGSRAQADYVLLRQQLEMAHEQLADMQRDMERTRMTNADRMAGTMARLRADLDSARGRERALELQLANAQAQNELLEFQLVELTEGRQQAKTAEMANKLCSTDFVLPMTAEEGSLDEELKKRHTLANDWLHSAQQGMARAVAFPLLGRPERLAVRHGLEALDCLQNQLGFAETELNMANCENGRLQRELETREREWHRQREEEAQLERQQRKKELKAELEQLRKERRDEATAFSRQVEELSGALNDKIHALSDLGDRAAELGAELDICRCQLAASQAENGTMREQLVELAKERDRAELEIGRAKAQLKEAEEFKRGIDQMLADKRVDTDNLRAELGQLRGEKEAQKSQLDQLRVVNRELEAQFNTQMDLIGALKRKLLSKQSEQQQQPGKVASPCGGGGKAWSAGITTRSCGSTEDEQYHSEGSSDDAAAQQQQQQQQKMKTPMGK